MKDKVSIIVPVYNASIYIERCVDSLLKQTYTNTEIILVDDGSVDNSLDICKNIERSYSNIKVYHKENGGASSARNFGLQVATGIYVTFCDVDDYVENNWVEVLYELIQKSDLGILSHYLHDDGNIIERKLKAAIIDKKDFNIQCFEMLRNTQIGYLWSMIFKAHIINGMRFNESMSFQEDLDFILRYIVRCNTISTSDVCCYHYTYISRPYCHTIEGVKSILSTLSNLLDSNNYAHCEEYYGTSVIRILLKHNDLSTIREIKQYREENKKYIRSCFYQLLVFFLNLPTWLSYVCIRVLLRVRKFILRNRRSTFMSTKRM